MNVFSRFSLKRRVVGFSILMLGVAALMHAICWLTPSVYKSLGGTVLAIHAADLHCLLAASDSHALGLGVDLSIPLDFMRRPHTYSSWWFGLASLGLGLRQLDLLVWVLVGFFAAVTALLLRPTSLVEAGIGVFLLGAFPIIALVERLNVDLLMFLFLYASAFCFGARRLSVLLLGVGLLLLGVGLKYYPAVALVLLLGVPDRRLRARAITLGLVGLLCVLWTLRRDFFATLLHVEIPHGIQGFGAEQLGEALGCRGWGALLLTWVPPVVASLWAWFQGGGGSSSRVEPPDFDERCFIAGASVLCFCNWALVNHHYRWVFGLLLVPLLMKQARLEVVGVRREARLLLWLLVGLPWLRSACCVFARLMFPLPHSERFYSTLEACSLALQLPVLVFFLLVLMRLVRFAKPRLLLLASDMRSALAPEGPARE